MTEDICSEKRCDLINQILKGTVDESYYCRTHKRHYYPNKPTDTMINPMTSTEQDKGLREQVVKCFTDTEMEHDQELTLFDTDQTIENLMQLITADRKRVALEARIDELEKTQRDFVHDESSEAFDEGRLYEQFLNGQLLAELTKDVTNPPK